MDNRPRGRKLGSAPPRVRTGQPVAPVDRAMFTARFRTRFADPALEPLADSIRRLEEHAWRAFDDGNKAPRTRRAGDGFADPDYELSVEWLATRDAIRAAEKRHGNGRSRPRILLICAAARNDQTCPGEMSKTFRLVAIARQVLESAGAECDLLDLSELTSGYQRYILPCKACVSTAMPLCHWPCSCYPNHALGQVNDWMNELYPRFVAAHGLMIVTPVYWYGLPGGFKSLLDRLVCADGGNPDPTSTHGKKPAEAKALELAGWPYPKHLAGRAFATITHGDVEGAGSVRRALVDTLSWMGLVPAGRKANLDRYVGYYAPYATSHDALDADTALQEEVRNAARALHEAVAQRRRGRVEPGDDLEDPRPK
jgi:multimeric flavodoxin WrbA